MVQYMSRQKSSLAATALVMCGIMLAAACSGEKKSELQVLGSDSALSRDLAMAARDSVQPQLQDIRAPGTANATPTPAKAPAPVNTPKSSATSPKPTVTPPPATTTPAASPAPPAALPVTGTVAAGTSMRFAASNKLCSNTARGGDRFTTELAAPVQASNGFEIPAGATGNFEVVASRTAANSSDSTTLTVRLVSVAFNGRTYPVDATVQSAATERVRSASKSTDAQKVAGGAIIGGIVGQVIGKNTKGTVIGAAAGAAAGTAAAAKTADYDTCLQSGATITVRLDAPAIIRPAPTP